MRPKVLSLLFCLLATGAAKSQEAPKIKPFIYGTAGFHIGRMSGVRLGAAAILAGKHEIGIGGQAYLGRSDKFPADYDCPSCKHGRSKDWIQGGAVTYGYVIHPRFMPGLLRVVIRGGVLFGKQSIPADFRLVTNPGPWEENYTYTDKYEFATAFLFSPSIDLALFRNPGFSIGPFAVVNKDLSSAGLTVGVLLGHIGTRDLVREREDRQKAARPQAASDKPPY